MRLTIPLPALLRRMLLASAGLAVFALGNFLTVKANIGQAPWNVFNLGLANYLPMTYGQVSILVSFLVVAADLLLREPIGLGTLLDAVLVGAFFDLYDAVGLLPEITAWWAGALAMLAGMVLMALSQYLYMSACIGCGPRDALLVGVGKRLRRIPIGGVSILIAGTVLLLGWLMGGQVGAGTVLFLVGNGVVMQMVFHLIRFEPRNLVHVGLHQLLSRERKGVER